MRPGFSYVYTGEKTSIGIGYICPMSGDKCELGGESENDSLPRGGEGLSLEKRFEIGWNKPTSVRDAFYRSFGRGINVQGKTAFGKKNAMAKV